jgi:hypothetical protein
MEEDTIFLDPAGGRVHALGQVARMMLSGNFNINALRTNDTLRKDEWKAMDQMLIEVAQTRLRAYTDLVAAGLVRSVGNPFGKTVYEWEQVSDLTDASVSMDVTTQTEMDRPEYTLQGIPLPVYHKDFRFNIRQLSASRTTGESIDITAARLATRKVLDQIEGGIVNGITTLKHGTYEIQGYTNAAQRNTVALSTAWTDSAKTGSQMLDDVLDMVSAAEGDKHYGPYVLYVPTAYGVAIEDDFKANSDRTIRERLTAIDSITAVRTLDTLSADNVVLVEMSQDTVDYIQGFEPTIVFWEEMGGMNLRFKVLAIGAPRVRHDAENQSGIVHLS